MESLVSVIIGHAKTVVPELQRVDISSESSLSALGLDSVERHEVLALTLETIGLDVPLVALHGPRNIQELAALLHAKLSA